MWSTKKIVFFAGIVIVNCQLSIVHSQIWSLDQCIDSAIQNNISVQKEQIVTQINKVNLYNSKSAVLPSLNSGVTHGYNWGQTIDLFTNQFATDRVQYDNFYLSSSISLFSGLRNYYDIRINKLNVEAGELKRQIYERNVKIDVSAAYLQVLLNREILQLAIDNLEQSKRQLHRIEELVNANQGTKAEYQEIEAQLELDKYKVIKAESDVKNSLLLLQNLMNHPNDASFDVSNSLVDSNLIYVIPASESISVEMPELLSIDLGIEKQLMFIKSLKGRYYPSVSLNGSTGSGYSENNKVLLSNGEFAPRPFDEQLNNNFYQSVYFSVNIPIFNKNIVRNQLKIEELELKSMYLDKQNEYNQLYQKLQVLSLEIVNLNAQITALQSVRESALRNFTNHELLFINGSATNFQMEEAKNKLTRVESELAQAKYQLLLKEMVMGFYLED